MGEISYVQRYGKKVAERDGVLCHYCKIPLMFGKKNGGEGFGGATIDHVICRIYGGSDELENLVLACFECNSERNTKSYETFLGYKRSLPYGFPRCNKCDAPFARAHIGGGFQCLSCAGFLD